MTVEYESMNFIGPITWPIKSCLFVVSELVATKQGIWVVSAFFVVSILHDSVLFVCQFQDNFDIHKHFNTQKICLIPNYNCRQGVPDGGQCVQCCANSPLLLSQRFFWPPSIFPWDSPTFSAVMVEKNEISGTSTQNTAIPRSTHFHEKICLFVYFDLKRIFYDRS